MPLNKFNIDNFVCVVRNNGIKAQTLKFHNSKTFLGNTICPLKSCKHRYLKVSQNILKSDQFKAEKIVRLFNAVKVPQSQLDLKTHI